jgi:hypothetical protein
MSKKEIDFYRQKQENFIKEWYKDPRKVWEKSHFYNLKSINKSLEKFIDFLPEPYIGNPNNPTAVFLNYNPGPVIECFQHRKDGRFIHKNKAHLNYSDFAKNNDYLIDNKGFWGTRRTFLSRLSNIPFEETSFFALEICPWHSDTFKLSKKDLDVTLNYLQNNVLNIAEAVASTSHFKSIFSVGKKYYDVFKTLDFKLISEINENNNLVNWPTNYNRVKTKRSISVWESKTNGIYLNTYAPGSNKISSKEFDNIILDLIK